MFGRATITLGIGPHSSLFFYFLNGVNKILNFIVCVVINFFCCLLPFVVDFTQSNEISFDYLLIWIFENLYFATVGSIQYKQYSSRIRE